MMELAFKAPKLRAGSVIWLAVNEFKRSLRTRATNAGAKVVIGNILMASLLGVVCFLVGQGAYSILQKGTFNSNYLNLLAGNQLIIAFGALFFMSLMTSFMYLTDRSDLDLLLSSPVKPQNIISARLLVGAWRTIFLFWIFGSMALLYSAILISPIYFSYLPTAIGLALLEAGLTFLVSKYILRIFGLANGRRFVQFIGFAGVFGGVYFTQIAKSSNSYSMKDFQKNVPTMEIPFLSREFIEFCGSALLGNWFAAFIILGFGIIIFAAITHLMGQSFAKDVSWLAGQSDYNKKKAKEIEEPIKFSSNFWFIVFKKELRAILRDATAIVQIIAPLAGLLPTIFMLINPDKAMAEFANYIAPPVIVFLSAAMSASLAWMIVSVEEAPELLKSSPKSIRKIYIAKAIVAILPAIIEILVFGLLVGHSNPRLFLTVIGFGILANISVIAIEFANPKPTKPPKMMQRPDRSISSIIKGVFVMLSWSVASSLFYFEPLWSLIPIGIAMAVLIWSVNSNDENVVNHAKVIWGKS